VNGGCLDVTFDEESNGGTPESIRQLVVEKSPIRTQIAGTFDVGSNTGCPDIVP
jgi:hypothetical protein